MLKSATPPDEILSLDQRWMSVPPLFFLSVAFSIGIWLASLTQPPFFWVALITFFALGTLTFCVRRRLFSPLSILMFFVMGVLFGVNDRTIADRHIALTAPAGPLILEGWVISVPETTLKGKKETVSFVLRSHSFFRKGNLSRTEGKVQVFLHNPGCAIHFGDRLRLQGTLEIPKENRNPHSFDYGNYLAQHGITRIFRGIGRFAVLRQSKGESNEFFLAATRLRIDLKEKLEKLFPSPYHELANALLFGFRKNISQEIQDAFIKTGTAHLIAISGLNISLVSGLFYFLLSFFLRLRRAVNLVLTLIFIAVYTLLAGANMPVLRAGVMGIVILFGFLMGHDRNLKSAFFFAFFVLLVWEPSALFQASFQLSFVAMASLIFILPQLEQVFTSVGVRDETNSIAVLRYRSRFFRYLMHIRRSIVQTFLASLAATIGMFPILIWYFNLFSVIGFLANMIAIPLCTLAIAFTLVLLLVDLIFHPLAQWLVFLPLTLLKLEVWLVNGFAKVPVGYFYLPRPPWFFFVLYYGFLILWIFLSSQSLSFWFRRACVITIGFVTGVFLLSAGPRSSRIVFFDLGKTDSVFISFSNGSNCLINTGRHFPNDQAYWILRPFFMASGIQKLDGILLTKIDGKHAGGFQTLSHHVRFQNVWVPTEFRKTSAWDKYMNFTRSKRLKVHLLSQRSRIQFGSDPNTYIEVLLVSERKRNSGGGTVEINALHIQDGKTKILYLASINADVLQFLSQSVPLDYDLIFLPHHEEVGTLSAKTLFLRRSSPLFIVSNQRDRIGKLEPRFEFPPASKVLFIDQSGAIEFYRSRGQLLYKTFLDPPSKASWHSKFHLAS